MADWEQKWEQWQKCSPRFGEILTLKEKLKRKKLYRLYSYIGRRNFLSYPFEASRIMDEAGIKKQVWRHWKRLQ